jgi:hypothetical protein
MAKNKITDLRDHLFETIELLKDKDSGMSVDKAKAIADVSQVIINTAKLEIDFVKATDRMDGIPAVSDFMNPKQLSA